MDSAREVCLVQFEDDSQFLVLWKDISPGETFRLKPVTAEAGVGGDTVGRLPDTLFSHSCPPWGGAALLCVSL